MMKKIYLLLTLLYVFRLSYACTMFASFDGDANSIVAAKNRDNRPDKQIIQVVAESGKLKYLALSRLDVPNFVSAGINEHNLAVFNEVTIEYAKKAKGGIADDFSKDILQSFSHIKDVIASLPQLVSKYPDPVFYQVVDNKQILAIEVAPGHKYSYRVFEQGIVAHTNNYLESDLIKGYQYTNSENSRLLASETRLKRAQLLTGNTRLATLADLQRIGLDQNARRNDGIYRTGIESNPASIKSLAFFAVRIGKDERKPSIFNAYLYTQGSKYSYLLDSRFWSQYRSGYYPLSPNGK